MRFWHKEMSVGDVVRVNSLIGVQSYGGAFEINSGLLLRPGEYLTLDSVTTITLKCVKTGSIHFITDKNIPACLGEHEKY